MWAMKSIAPFLQKSPRSDQQAQKIYGREKTDEANKRAHLIKGMAGNAGAEVLKLLEAFHPRMNDSAVQFYTHFFNTRAPIFEERIDGTHSMIAVCVGNELHEIGMRMVADFFELSGWDSVFLGSNIPNQMIIEQLLENKTHVLAVSATPSASAHTDILTAFAISACNAEFEALDTT